MKVLYFSSMYVGASSREFYSQMALCHGNTDIPNKFHGNTPHSLCTPLGRKNIKAAEGSTTCVKIKVLVVSAKGCFLPNHERLFLAEVIEFLNLKRYRLLQ